MFVAKGQGTEVIRSRIYLARSAYSPQQFCFGRGVKYRCVERVGSTKQWCGRKTWPVRVVDERMLADLNNDSIHHILRIRRRDCVPSVELRRRLCLTSEPALLVQRRLRWFGHAKRRSYDELIKDLLLLKTWASAIKRDLPVFGFA